MARRAEDAFAEIRESWDIRLSRPIHPLAPSIGCERSSVHFCNSPYRHVDFHQFYDAREHTRKPALEMARQGICCNRQ